MAIFSMQFGVAVRLDLQFKENVAALREATARFGDESEILGELEDIEDPEVAVMIGIMLMFAGGQ